MAGRAEVVGLGCSSVGEERADLESGDGLVDEPLIGTLAGLTWGERSDCFSCSGCISH